MAGFEFKKKREVTICGKAYPCDFSDSRMLEGVAHDFPRILIAAQEMSGMYHQMLDGVHAGKPSAEYTEMLLQKNDKLVEVCRTFIEGTIGIEEYAEIFGSRTANSGEHIDLCAYIYGEIMDGRQEMLDQYLAPEVKEAESHDAADTDTEPDNAGAAGQNPGTADPDRLAVVDEKRGLRAWIAAALGRKA